ncbi:MAG: hypothetical protein KDJ65_34075 [Anaerolineae bacterium]|nr:hypothetical protein [Anaerolineae bacterium]
MTPDQFKESTSQSKPPANISQALAAMWWSAKGEWDTAHQLIQPLSDGVSIRIHGYLHRQEGDDANAAYWYRRTGMMLPRNTLEEEWEEIVEILLE